MQCGIHLVVTLSCSIYCDPAAMSPSLGTYTDQLADPQVYGAFGIHPHSAKFYDDKLEQRVVAALQHPKAVAWGECGLDVRILFATSFPCR